MDPSGLFRISDILYCFD